MAEKGKEINLEGRKLEKQEKENAMKKNPLGSVLMACMAMFSFLCLSLTAQAAPVQSVSSGGDFFVSSVYEEPGSPPVIRLYGSSSRAPLTATAEFGVLTSTDGFATPPSWQAISGVVGYAPAQVNSAFVICPPGKACGGYKAFYILEGSPGKLYRCTGLASWKDLSGCSEWVIPGILQYHDNSIGLDQTGNKLLMGAEKSGDPSSQIYAIDIATSSVSKLTDCSSGMASMNSIPAGSIAGEGGAAYFYLSYAGKLNRFSWNGSNCTGARAQLDGSGPMGWDNSMGSGGDKYFAAVGNLTGTLHYSLIDGQLFISKKNPFCGDTFLGGGEQCDGSIDPGKTCLSEKGPGWSGSLSCTGCAIDQSGCSYGWGVKNLKGACTLGGSGVNQTVNFSGGTCTAEYWPIGASSATYLKWAAEAGKALAITVVDAGAPTTVTVPEGVSHEEVDDNGNKYELEWGSGVSAGVEGTSYYANEMSYPIVQFGCHQGAIRLKYSSTPIASINIDGTPGRLPAGYGVEVNVLTGDVTKAPYKLDGTGGDGGAGGDSGAGGDAGNGGSGGNDDGGGCSCATPGLGTANPTLILLAMAMLCFSRRMNRR